MPRKRDLSVEDSARVFPELRHECIFFLPLNAGFVRCTSDGTIPDCGERRSDIVVLAHIVFFVFCCSLSAPSQSAQGSSRVPWIFPHAWTVVGTGNPPIAVQYSCKPNASGSARKLLLLQTAQSKTNYSFSTVSRIYVLACKIYDHLIFINKAIFLSLIIFQKNGSFWPACSIKWEEKRNLA